MDIRMNRQGIDELAHDPALAEQLRPAAEKILTSARRKAPSWVQDARWFVRVGVSDRGAFAQAIARGSGVVAAEYGGSRSPAYAYFRGSIR